MGDFQPALGELNVEFVSLWAHDRQVQQRIRINDSYKLHTDIGVSLMPHLSHRMRVYYEAVHTLINYNPQWSQNSMASKIIAQSRKPNTNHNRPREQQSHQYTVNDFYPQAQMFFKQVLGSSAFPGMMETFTIGQLNSDNKLQSNASRRQEMQRIAGQVRAWLRVRTNIVRLQRKNKTAALMLWLLLPHPNHEVEVVEDLEFCLAFLAQMVDKGTIMTEAEWNSRVQRGLVNGMGMSSSVGKGLGKSNLGQGHALQAKISQLTRVLYSIKNNFKGHSQIQNEIIQFIHGLNMLQQGLPEGIQVLQQSVGFFIKFFGWATGSTVQESSGGTVQNDPTDFRNTTRPVSTPNTPHRDPADQTDYPGVLRRLTALKERLDTLQIASDVQLLQALSQLEPVLHTLYNWSTLYKSAAWLWSLWERVSSA
jgi:hypothetical protein